MIRITLDAKDTVGDLRRQVKQELKVPLSRQHLSIGGIKLERDHMVVSELMENGDIVLLKADAPAKRKPLKQGEGEGKKRQKKAKGKCKTDGPEVFGWEGDDAESIAQTIRAHGAEGGKLSSSGIQVYLRTMQMHRLSAAAEGKYRITELLDPSDFTSSAVSRGKKYLSVEFSHGRKKHKEFVALYGDETIKGVIAAMVRTHTTAKRVTLKSSLRAIGAEKAAFSSPPLFWSVRHEYPEVSVESTFKALVQEAYDKFEEERGSS
eukprot:CAMPEP_0184479144 /NCGR_PEP_ID=MMETSP0113_2-20130426/978_1 /TAXON_ID=91329 /ORGANISM="Norrisiella sphaerica, Strain BC52" /LENGTH=263 /DNA_ID=CAMNT_0026857161 /DNA_START=219 /DNA_END=1010 /DNA_ORIENTATION=+